MSSMGTVPVQIDPKITSFEQQIDSLLNNDPATLLRADLQSMGFQAAADDVRRVYRVLQRLRACDFDLLSENKWQICTNFVNEVVNVFSRMRSFSPAAAQGPPAAERQRMVEQCKALIVTGNEKLGEIFGMAAPTLRDTDAEVRSLVEELKTQANKTLEQTKAEATKARDEVTATLESIRAATGAIGIEKQAEVFKNAAKEHDEGRKTWLTRTVGLAAVTLIALVANWALAYEFGPPSSSRALIQLTVAKVLVFSLLLSAIVWSGRVYRAHQHNYVVNKHRQNALETFQLFARAADGETKNMVLLQATKCIFGPQATGFLTGEKDSDSGGPQVLEIIRSLASSQKS